ncbi:CCA tRNA nucleotidyltransferase [Haloarchaeobius iranensis]|uniref:CCA-adding enzyme n=1 Tax=Haloarchaeobius iranensis TaxID=996166 RepID=A0A1G9XAE7_9EURY|nr:CCA tRNA nucleotidyltransferase [Haloarchaeobius iranensis]SDM93704.1 tRNA nucleotidyltransferase (CCA-adding enzyme) [Haloarchaeobius iranensis]
MSEDAFEATVAAVRERVDPSSSERERLRAVADELVERAEDAATERVADADVVQVGSTARGTWTAGDRDIDVFVRFPTDIDRETLEQYGLEVGREVLPDGHEEYAEHPYVKGEYEGFDVDLVPCFRVDAATGIRSAVDRTPFHNAYLRERLDDELAGDVRVAKAFCKGIGVYGSDLRTQGFSGYLVELLVLEYGGFRELVTAAAEWHPQVERDPESHGTRSFEDPLVVVDPTDPERNVAAVVSPANVARLQHHARALLADPDPERFEPREPDPLSPAEVRAQLAARGTTPVAVRFDPPDVVADQLWPQLRKSLDGVTDALDRRGFDTFRATALADGTAALFVELAVAERPAVERHDGPPVHVREHATGFYEKYAAMAETPPYGPFVDGDDRYVVERAREFTTAAAFLRSDALFDVALGSGVERALADDYEVLVGDEVATLATAFGTELAAYFSPRP